MASGSGIGTSEGELMGTAICLHWQWREGESSPDTGNLSARPAGKPGSLFAEERLRRCLLRHCPVTTAQHTERSVCVFKAWRNLSGPMWFQNQNQSQNQTPGRDRAASRWSAPSPGKRTRRENHALSHRPQMSSVRLFLDRVARQHCPPPLHRHRKTNTASLQPPAKQDISTLQRIGHFYFALTAPSPEEGDLADSAIAEDVDCTATQQAFNPNRFNRLFQGILLTRT